MRLGRFLVLSVAIAATGCDRDDAGEEPSEPSGQQEAAATEVDATSSPGGLGLSGLTGETECPELSITVDGEAMAIGSVHAYTGISFAGEYFGEFVRASEAADESCEEILANTGVTRDGEPVRYVTAFESPRASTYNTLMVTGWSQTNVPLRYEENDDGTRTICITEETRFTGPGDREYVVVGEMSGPYCGEMRM